MLFGLRVLQPCIAATLNPYASIERSSLKDCSWWYFNSLNFAEIILRETPLLSGQPIDRATGVAVDRRMGFAAPLNSLVFCLSILLHTKRTTSPRIMCERQTSNEWTTNNNSETHNACACVSATIGSRRCMYTCFDLFIHNNSMALNLILTHCMYTQIRNMFRSAANESGDGNVDCTLKNEQINE